jgi:Ni/Co efflux regulator RcnB
MKLKHTIFALPIMALALSGLPAFSQDHPDHDQAQPQDHHDNGSYKQHDEWKKGSQIKQDDWNRGDKVDYQAKHLKKAPAGHEWRQIDGNYVLAKEDGTIVSVRPAPRDHQKSSDKHPQ